MRRSRPWWVLAIVALSACADTDCPTCQDDDPVVAEPAIENVWPHEDGRSWTFAVTRSAWPDSFTSPATLLGLDDVDSLLAIEAPPTAVSLEYDWRLWFGGTTALATGPEVPLLRGEVAGPTEPAAAPDDPGGIMLEGDVAFASSSQWIGRFDHERRLVWKYLERDLSPGATFHFAMPHGFRDDARASVRVRAIEDVSTAVGTFENALVAEYVLDRGVRWVPDESTGSFLASRSYVLGRIVYAPGVGPILCVERDVRPEIHVDDASGVATRTTYRLAATARDG